MIIRAGRPRGQELLPINADVASDPPVPLESPFATTQEPRTSPDRPRLLCLERLMGGTTVQKRGLLSKDDACTGIPRP